MKKLSAKSLQLKAKRGFTLIEILIVVGIIGLLASVVLSGLGSVRGRGRDARRTADLRQVQQALELYYTRCQFYPGTASCASQTAPSDWGSLKSALVGSGIGITSLPSDPLFSGDAAKNYKYAVSADGQEYILEAILEDSKSPILKDSYNEPTPSGFSGANVNCQNTQTGHYCIKF